MSFSSIDYTTADLGYGALFGFFPDNRATIVEELAPDGEKFLRQLGPVDIGDSNLV